MNKKELMQRSAQVTADIHVVYLGMIADYLKDNGGSHGRGSGPGGGA